MRKIQKHGYIHLNNLDIEINRFSSLRTDGSNLICIFSINNFIEMSYKSSKKLFLISLDNENYPYSNSNFFIRLEDLCSMSDKAINTLLNAIEVPNLNDVKSRISYFILNPRYHEYTGYFK